MITIRPVAGGRNEGGDSRFVTPTSESVWREADGNRGEGIRVRYLSWALPEDVSERRRLSEPMVSLVVQFDGQRDYRDVSHAGGVIGFVPRGGCCGVRPPMEAEAERSAGGLVVHVVLFELRCCR